MPQKGQNCQKYVKKMEKVRINNGGKVTMTLKVKVQAYRTNGYKSPYFPQCPAYCSDLKDVHP